MRLFRRVLIRGLVLFAVIAATFTATVGMMDLQLIRRDGEIIGARVEWAGVTLMTAQVLHRATRTTQR